MILIAGSGTSSMLAIRSAASVPLKKRNTVGLKILKAAPPCTSDIAARVPKRKNTDSWWKEEWKWWLILHLSHGWSLVLLTTWYATASCRKQPVDSMYLDLIEYEISLKNSRVSPPISDPSSPTKMTYNIYIYIYVYIYTVICLFSVLEIISYGCCCMKIFQLKIYLPLTISPCKTFLSSLASYM